MRRRDFLALASILAASGMVFPVNLPADMTQTAPGDPRNDAQYLGTRIKHISDADLLAAMNLGAPGLQKMRAAVQKQDFTGAYEAWAGYWTTIAPARAQFIGPDGLLDSLDQAAALFAGSKSSILQAAGRVLKHDIQGWGTVSIQHGPVVDFNADYGKSGKYGFHYWGWAQCLIQAYLLTRDEKYLASFDELFNQWYEQRDKVHGDWPGLDPVYYELGLGVRNRIFFEDYFLPFDKRTTQTHERMLKTLLGAARWLFDEEAMGYREHNWQIIGSYGLAQIGLMVPEFRESHQWVKLGTQRMLEHLAKDFFPDGCHSERCPASYMIIAYRDPRNLARLLSRDSTESELAKKLRAPLEKSLDFWLGILPPDGILPGINDGSRSPMLPAIFQDGYDLYGRGEMMWVNQHLLGAPPEHESSTSAGATSAASTTAASVIEPAFKSIHFPASGFTAMRSDWNKEARYLLINHGPYAGGHSHSDALSFELNAFGKAMAIDAGIGETYDDPLQLSWYVHSRAHNMLTIDGEDCDRAKAQGVDVAWTSNEEYDHFAATHHGYEASKGIIHRRHILFVKPDYFVVYDVIECKAGAGERWLEWNLHLTTPPDAKTGPALLVKQADHWAISMDKGSASVLGIDGFGGKHQAMIDWMKITAPIRAGETRSIAVLLYPFAKTRPEIEFTRSPGQKAAFTARVDEKIQQITFTHGGVNLT
jgi:hypothetical protein